MGRYLGRKGRTWGGGGVISVGSSRRFRTHLAVLARLVECRIVI